MYETLSRAAIAALLLTLAGCGATPVRESADLPAIAAPATASPVIATPPVATVEVPAASMPAPVVGVTAARLDPPLAPAPMVATARAVSKPAAAPATKPAVAAKPAAAPVVEVASREISGTLKLVAGSGQSVSAGEISEGLVYFLPKAGSPKPKPGRYSINTRSKGFVPETLVVTQGSTVRFPNVDTIIHNVYSRSPGNTFDLGYYGPGKSPEYTFNSAGLAIVNCTVHHTMRANVVVLATPYYARPGKDGRYQIKDIPAGPGTLVFWHPRATARSVQASAPQANGGVQTLVASKSSQVH